MFKTIGLFISIFILAISSFVLATTYTGPAIRCTANASLDMTTATTTEIVALSGSTKIFMCSFSIVSDGVTATNVKFVSGTGADCVTGQTNLSSNIPLTAATDTVGIARGSGEGIIIKSIVPGDALCVTSSGAATLGIDISFAQF